MIIKGLISVSLIFIGFICLAQDNFSRDIEFIEHFEVIGEYNEGVIYIDKVSRLYTDRSQLDSLHFFKGRYLYEQKKIDLAIEAFQSVSSFSEEFWEISQFYLSFLLAYQRKLDSALLVLDNASFSNSLFEEVKVYEQASAFLLKRDFKSFDRYSNQFTYNYYQLSDYEEDMLSIADNIKLRRQKSPFLAGVMSAIVPGSGKYYQGKIGQGTMALVGTGIFALQAYEGYRKDGIESARFIIFGSLFSVFYVANIWGSVVSVRVNETRFNDTADEVIYINMHLPIRLLFR